MPVLKANNAAPMIKEAVVLDLGDLGRQAAKLRRDAEARAARILDDAQRQAERMIAGAEEKGFEQGRGAGYEQGLAQGRQQGHAQALEQARGELEQLHATWSDVAGKLESQRRRLETEARQAVLTFALRMAEKLVHRTIEVDPTVIVDQIANALAQVLQPLDVAVRIHPEDRPLVEQAMPDLCNEFKHLTHIHLTDDTTISRGGCTLSFGQGRIDATIETQIARTVAMILPAKVQQTQAGALTGAAVQASTKTAAPPDPGNETDPQADNGTASDGEPGEPGKQVT